MKKMSLPAQRRGQRLVKKKMETVTPWGGDDRIPSKYMPTSYIR